MRKWTPWIIAVAMSIMMALLIYLQYQYVRAVYSFRADRFDTQVYEALSEVAKAAEKDELTRIITERLSLPATSISLRSTRPLANLEAGIESSKLGGSSGSGLSMRADTIALELNFNQKSIPISAVRSETQDRFSSTSLLILDAIEKKYDDLRTLLLEMAMESIHSSPEKPFYRHISNEKLNAYLEEAMAEQKVELPFIYEVLDHDGRLIYNTGKISEKQLKYTYIQQFFPQDHPSRRYELRVFFAGRSHFLNSGMHFLYPTIGLTVLLLFLFVFSTVSLFRQKKMDALRTDFINNMTHELRTPVSNIMLSSQMLLDPDTEGNQATRERALAAVMNEGRRLDLLIDKVLQMSFFDKDRVKPHMAEMDMEELVISVASTFGLKVEGAGGTLDLDLEATDTMILGDAMHLTNILSTLLENALKYQHPERPPEIWIRTSNHGGAFCVSIEDNGIGIKREYLKKIFQRFFRVPTGNRHDTKGFGLGLAYVQSTLRLHGGSIVAESELGKGTKFVIKLPLIRKKGI